MLPYFRPPDVAGLHRCYFEFRSQEVNQWVDRYRGYKRYRFNKYVPISDRFPEPTVDGLVFKVSNSTTERLIGMQTAWNLPAGYEVIFHITKAELINCDPLGFAEFGVGFQQYDTSWWWAVDALLFSCQRQSGPLNQVKYCTLRNEVIAGSGHLSGIGTAFTVIARNTGTQLELHYTEFAADGITPVVSHVEIQPLASVMESYPVVMYCRSDNATASYLLAKTEIRLVTDVAPFVLTTQDFPYNGTDGTDGTPYKVDLETGTYYIEAWGAGQNGIDAGRGGYTAGRLTVNTGFPVYVYVGGTPSSFVGGWNGGGTSGEWGGEAGLGGCGASDIRLEAGLMWDEDISLRSRIMVAAGGGRTTEAGDGGGLEGIWATHGIYSSLYIGAPGSQEEGGLRGRAYYGDVITVPIVFNNEELFNRGFRFSHSGIPQPSNAAELSGWTYDPATDILCSSINSLSFIGLVSDIVTDAYDLQAKLIANNADDDRMGIVLAFATDDTGREHTLTAIRNNDSPAFTWRLVYNYMQPDIWVIADGSGTVPRGVPSNWGAVYPEGTVIQVERRQNLISVWTSQFGDAAIDPLTLLAVDLTTDPRLDIFNQECALGFACHSQAQTQFVDVVCQTYHMEYPYSGTTGVFGKGGDGGRSQEKGWGHGGAGGWYGSGGAGGAITGSFPTSGGSSFISGHTGCIAVDDMGVPTAHSIHFSGLKFTVTTIQAAERAEDHGFVRIRKIFVPPKITPFTAERIYFYENPTEYTLPLGPLQAPALDIYSQPHIAYIEDGTIQLASPAAPQGWVNLLYFLLDSTVEPMIFSDITGAKWLTCFQEVTGKGRKVQGKTASGYELRLPVLVVH